MLSRKNMITPWSQEKMQAMNLALEKLQEKWEARGKKVVNIFNFSEPEEKGYLYDFIVDEIHKVLNEAYEFNAAVKEKYAPRNIKPTDPEWRMAVALADRVRDLRGVLEPIYYRKGIPELSKKEPLKW